MGFKYWLFNEAGHFTMAQPSDLTVLYHGHPVIVRGVTLVDPRFEFMNVPMPKFEPEDPRRKMTYGKKFLGQFTFSLPVVDPDGKRINRWIVVPRKEGIMFGSTTKAYIASKPEGIQAPLDWADHADIMDDNGKVPVTYGGNVAI